MFATIKIFREDGGLLHEATFNPLQMFRQGFQEGIIEHGHNLGSYRFIPHVRDRWEPFEVRADGEVE